VPDENVTTALPKADRISLATSSGGDSYALHFPEPLGGITLGRIIDAINGIIPDAYFHFCMAAVEQRQTLLRNTMLAFTPVTSVTTDDLNKLVEMFQPKTHLIATANIQSGQRSFEVTMTVMNFGEDTLAEKYRELVDKLQSVPSTTEVSWDGESEIFMLVSGDVRQIFQRWVDDMAEIAGISVRPNWVSNSPLGAMRLVSALLGCGHTHH
jgi:hypothetical protein